ncbi:MAG: potassium transporter, partial [Gammaproteobacteria bacterium]
AVGAVAGGAAWLLGLPPGPAALVGGAVAMSSTALVARQLGEQMELSTRHGRAALGVLLFQDLATLPFLVLLASLAGQGGRGLAAGLLVAAAVGVAMVAAGRWLLGPLVHWVSGTRSTELFMLTALLVIIGAAAVADLAGLSPPLGAFLAGMVLGETEFRHQMEDDIRPFQEVLVGLFFATIGMAVDPAALGTAPGTVALLLAAVVLGKLGLVAVLARPFTGDPSVALRTALCLAHGGEFGLLLVAGALQAGVLPASQGQPLLGALVLSMAVAPLLVRHNGTLARWLSAVRHRERLVAVEQEMAQETAGLQGHVIIAGYGRMGQNVAQMLHEEGVPYVALDLDPGRVRQAHQAGEPVFFGDARRERLLKAAGLQRAGALAITIDHPQAAHRIVHLVRRERKDLPVLVRVRDDRYLDTLLAAGATEVLAEQLEASLILGAELLMLLGRPASQVMDRVAEIRAQEYRPLRQFFHGSDERHDRGRPYARELASVVVGAESWARGRRLDELGLEGLGVSVVAVRRGGIKVPAPALDTRLREGDVLVLAGEPEALEAAAARLARPGRARARIDRAAAGGGARGRG